MFEPLIFSTVIGMPVNIFTAFFGFMWFVYLWDTYLDYRQYKTILTTSELPEELSNIIDEENFVKSKAYALDKGLFSFVHGIYNQTQLSCILYFAVIPWLWEKSHLHGVILNEYIQSKLGIDLGIQEDSEIKISLLFILYCSIFSFFDSLPWSLYSTFVIEERHGFNKQTLKFFFKDKIKMFIVSIAIGFPIIATLIWIIKVGGPNFYIYAYIFILTVTLFMMYIYPEFIAPLFDRYEPLPQGNLREKIEALASSISFPLKKLLVVQGSKRSAHSNAYFYGFGNNKRIVLYDTLIRGFKFPGDDGGTGDVKESGGTVSPIRGCSTDEEVVSVLAHELGHWKLGHTITNLIISQVNLFLTFLVFSTLMNKEIIYSSFGFSDSVPIILKLLVIFQFVLSPYNTVLNFLLTVLSRRLEFQADNFAVTLNFGIHLKDALVCLHKDNLSFPVCDWLYSMFNYSHPPTLERLRAIDVLLSKQK